MNIAKLKPFSYYIGRSLVTTSNAMLKEVADYLQDYEFSIVNINPVSFFHSVKEDVDNICKRYPRYKPINLQYAIIPFGVRIYAFKVGSDKLIVSLRLNEILNHITL